MPGALFQPPARRRRVNWRKTLDFAVLGCSLDALDAQDKLAMKLAYLFALREGLLGEGIARDPYDMLVGNLSELPGVSVGGKLELESVLTPRPAAADLDDIQPGLFREFLDTGGCGAISARLREFVKKRVLPLRPLLVGVDHSLTGGVLEAIAAAGEEPVLVILDSHFDAIPAGVRRAATGLDTTGEGELSELPDSYNCGTWLAEIIDRGLVSPGSVVVLGPSDDPGERREGEPEGMAAYRGVYRGLEERGVRIFPKKRLREAGIDGAVEQAMAGLEGRPLYISLDADVASGEEVKAVRFLDTVGLSFDEVVQTARALREWLEATGSKIAGLDIMEIDVHLADIPGSGDRTLEMCEVFVAELLAEPSDE